MIAATIEETAAPRPTLTVAGPDNIVPLCGDCRDRRARQRAANAAATTKFTTALEAFEALDQWRARYVPKI